MKFAGNSENWLQYCCFSEYSPRGSVTVHADPIVQWSLLTFSFPGFVAYSQHCRVSEWLLRMRETTIRCPGSSHTRRQQRYVMWTCSFSFSPTLCLPLWLCSSFFVCSASVALFSASPRFLGPKSVFYFLHFYRAMRCISAVFAVMQCLSVCPSVCPSVTFVDHVKTNKHIFKIF